MVDRHIALCAESKEENKKGGDRVSMADGITLVLGSLWGIFNAHRPQGCI